MLGAAGIALVLLTWGMTNPTHSLVVHDLLDHPVPLGLLAWLLLALGIAGHVEHPQVRAVAAIVLSGVGITCFALGGVVIASQVNRDHAVKTSNAPDPSSLEAVLDDDGDGTHPVARIVIQDRRWSLGAHRHEVACVQGAPGQRPVTSMRWTGADAIELTLADGDRHLLAVGADGSVDQPLRVGLLCRR